VKTELKTFFGEKLCTTTIPRNIRLAEAPSHGKAALEYDPRSKGAESYIKLAKEIIERQVASGQIQTAVMSEAVVEPEAFAELITTEDTGERGNQEAGVEEMPAKDDMDKTA
jgi:nitrogenase subunit NifH